MSHEKTRSRAKDSCDAVVQPSGRIVIGPAPSCHDSFWGVFMAMSQSPSVISTYYHFQKPGGKCLNFRAQQIAYCNDSGLAVASASRVTLSSERTIQPANSMRAPALRLRAGLRRAWGTARDARHSRAGGRRASKMRGSSPEEVL